MPDVNAVPLALVPVLDLEQWSARLLAHLKPGKRLCLAELKQCSHSQSYQRLLKN